MIKNDTKIEVGDWVRFYSLGRLIIGEVTYLQTKTGGFKYALTDQGEVSFDSILEVRKCPNSL